MSKYTTELRYICEEYAGLDESEGYNKISDIIDASRSKIFDFDYPIFDASYRNVLENKILRHFYLREICAETVGVWKHFLEMRMNEIMPYYNKLYESELIEFNPMYDVDLTKDYNKDDKGTGTVQDALHQTDSRDISKTDSEARHLGASGTNTGTVTDTGTVADTGTVKDTGTVTDTGTDTNAKTGSDNDVKKNLHWDVYSDTPQGALTNVASEAYLTNARKVTDDGTGSTTTYNSTNTETKNLTRTDNLTKTNDLTRTNNLTRTDNLANSLTEDETNNQTSRIDDDNERNSTNTKTRNLRDIEDYIEHVKGKTGGVSFSKLLQEFRETFLNIDVMIINDLNDLFFGLW